MALATSLSELFPLHIGEAPAPNRIVFVDRAFEEVITVN